MIGARALIQTLVDSGVDVCFMNPGTSEMHFVHELDADPEVEALTAIFAYNDGIKVLHDGIQYLVERSEGEQEWLTALARAPFPVTVIWGLYDTVSPPRVASYVWDRIPDVQARRQPLVLHPGRESLSAGRPARRLREGALARARTR